MALSVFCSCCGACCGISSHLVVTYALSWSEPIVLAGPLYVWTNDSTPAVSGSVTFLISGGDDATLPYGGSYAIDGSGNDYGHGDPDTLRVNLGVTAGCHGTFTVTISLTGTSGSVGNAYSVLLWQGTVTHTFTDDGETVTVTYGSGPASGTVTLTMEC